MRTIIIIVALALVVCSTARIITGDAPYREDDYDEFNRNEDADVPDEDESLTMSMTVSDMDDFLEEGVESITMTLSDSTDPDLADYSDDYEKRNRRLSDGIDDTETAEHTLTPLITPTHEGVYADDSFVAVPYNESAVVKSLEASSDDVDGSESSDERLSEDAVDIAQLAGVRILDEHAVQQLNLFSLSVSQAYRDAFFGALLSVFTVGTLAILIILAHAVRRRQLYELHHPHPENKHPYEDHPHAPIHIV